MRFEPTWRQVLAAHAHAILAIDTVFLRRLDILVVIEHGRRRVPASPLIRPGQG